MAEETITFELIRKVQRKEQRKPKLTELPEDFYENVRGYLERKRKAKGRKVALEVKNVERLVEDIYNRRERKMFNLALITARTKIPPENLTDEEKDFFNKIVAIVKRRRKELLDKLLQKEGEEELANLIVFKEDVPKFVGADTKSYGPFKKGDIARLPEENMRVMIEKGVAEKFKVKK